MRLAVYNLRGRRVRLLEETHRLAGRYRVSWDGRDDGSNPVGSGIYVLRMEAGPFTARRKVGLIR